jgi:hypothetical protein
MPPRISSTRLMMMKSLPRRTRRRGRKVWLQADRETIRIDGPASPAQAITVPEVGAATQRSAGE